MKNNKLFVVGTLVALGLGAISTIALQSHAEMGSNTSTSANTNIHVEGLATIGADAAAKADLGENDDVKAIDKQDAAEFDGSDKDQNADTEMNDDGDSEVQGSQTGTIQEDGHKDGEHDDDNASVNVQLGIGTDHESD